MNSICPSDVHAGLWGYPEMHIAIHPWGRR